MATATNLTSFSKTSNSSTAENLFNKIQTLESYLEELQSDLSKLDQ